MVWENITLPSPNFKIFFSKIAMKLSTLPAAAYKLKKYPQSNHFSINVDPIPSSLKIEEARFSETMASTYSIKRCQKTQGD
jgi:hypothetical protein